jgi:hypothetical protein
MPMKEKLVKILAPGVGWKEMAAQNRRRNDTSKHAVGVWEEFSFLDKGSCVGIGARGVGVERGLWERGAREQRDLLRCSLASVSLLSFHHLPFASSHI